MKIHILSDLHTEFSEFEPPETDADVVVHAGDIGIGTDGIQWADQLFNAASANIHVLSNSTLELDGVRFLGSTLWTDFRLYGEGEAWFSRQKARALIGDFVSIRNGVRPFTPEDSVELHEASKAWLVSELQKEFEGTTIVVTHHLPAMPSINSQYRNHVLNPAFASRLEDVIERYQPDLWIHGHTHVPCDYELFGTRVVCNPRGYPSESSGRGFSPALVVEV